eukprot:Seg4620.1 transcript_id=Seg4620.1/GoldUCD/mRNA.D3Y31 product="hypothetical protein" protein_id=Seg4620.1/GoldUCD/D3Y31
MSTKKLKVYVYDVEFEKIETRKIIVNRGKVLEELRSVLPHLRKVEYEDEDGDVITATSDPELTMAIFEEGLTALKAICDTKTVPLPAQSSCVVSERNDGKQTPENRHNKQSTFKETNKMADVNVEEASCSVKDDLSFLSPPPAKKRCEFVDLSSHDELSIEIKIQSYLEKEKGIHVDRFGFPVDLKLNVLTEDSLKIECGICCRWISINNFRSKKLCHLKDHFNTSLHLSNTELQKSRVAGHSAELPKLQANREILRQTYSRVFHLVGNKAECKYCLKDGMIDLLPKTGGFKQSGISRLRERRDILKDKVKDFAKNGKVGAIAMNIVKAYKDGKFKDKQALLSMLHVTSKNLNRQSIHGHRYLDTKEDNDDYTDFTKDYYYVLKAWGGPRLAMFVALNNLGPNIRTVSRWVKDKCYQYKLGLGKDNLHYVTNVIKEAMEAHGIKHSVPCVTAEDETWIIERVEYNQGKDEAWGFCGEKKEDHVCEEDFVVTVGNDEGSYSRIVDAFKNNQKAGYLRIIILSPLHRKLPRIVTMIQATCNRFTHADVKSQWRRLLGLASEEFEKQVGPIIGHASDGDARRRKLMLENATNIKEDERFQPIQLSDGFPNGLKFPNSNEKTEIIWPKQYARPLPKQDDVLKVYPSKNEEIKLWKDGVDKARDFASLLGMSPSCYKRTSLGPWDAMIPHQISCFPRNDWFYSPNTYKPLFEKNVLSDMCDDEENDEEETPEASDSSTLNENVTDDDSTIIEDQNEIEGIMEDDVYVEGMQGQMHTILNGLEEQNNTSDENISATMKIPGVGVRYKSTVIAELNENEKLSLDRLKRVRAPVRKGKGTATNEVDEELACLFDDWAIKSSKESCGYVIGHIVRIRRKGKKRGYVEYTRPISTEESQETVGVEIIYQKYESVRDIFSFKLGALFKISPKNLLSKVNVMVEGDLYIIDANEQDKCATKVLKRQRFRPTEGQLGVTRSADESERQNARQLTDAVQYTDFSSRGRVRHRTFNMSQFINL